MALPDFSMRQLLEAGVHFGHQKHRWNPKMGTYIYGVRDNIHIIDLAQTVPMLYRALQQISDTVAAGGRVLFVGTKRQASEPITNAAKRCAQYYVNARWLGGMLTNWNTMSKSIKRLRELDDVLDGGASQGLTKKERLTLTRERDRLERDLGGIRDMGGVPDLLFVIDTNKEAIAIQEARRLGIPVAAIIDSNCDPDLIQLPIPGNDDAGRAITLYCDLAARAAIDGISRASGDAGVDIGEAVDVAEQAEADAAQAVESQVADVDMTAAEKVEPQAIDSAPAPESTPVTTEEAPTPVEAAAPAEDDTATALFEVPAGEADDLKKISGVGPVLEKKLLELGVTRFDQIAAFSDEDVARVDDALNFKGRILRDDWIGQATKLAGGA
ncbi:MAG: 30S ribosomal protein S2 [Alphaproteobacteria bacterium]